MDVACDSRTKSRKTDFVSEPSVILLLRYKRRIKKHIRQLTNSIIGYSLTKGYSAPLICNLRGASRSGEELNLVALQQRPGQKKTFDPASYTS